LEGNFRDLENIAKDYKIFNDFDEETREEICSEMKIPVSALEYTKKCYEMYHLNPPTMEKIEVKIPTDFDAKSIADVFHRQLREWAIKKFGTRKEAAIQLSVSEKTLDNWKE
jgi:DNA-binding NtrC family response regulator